MTERNLEKDWSVCALCGSRRPLREMQPQHVESVKAGGTVEAWVCKDQRWCWSQAKPQHLNGAGR